MIEVNQAMTAAYQELTKATDSYQDIGVSTCLATLAMAARPFNFSLVTPTFTSAAPISLWPHPFPGHTTLQMPDTPIQDVNQLPWIDFYLSSEWPS